MKKLLHTIIAVLLSFTAFSQSSSNNCTEALNAINITADGIFFVAAIDGNAPPLSQGNLCSGGNTYSNSPFGEWFALTYPTTQNITVSSSYDGNNNSGKDTRLNVYTGNCSNLTCIDGSDDFNNMLLSEVTFTAQANTTYYIVWDNRWVNSNNFSFKVTTNTAVTPPTFSTGGLQMSGSKNTIVDMNGDYLDDVVAINYSSSSSDKVNIRYQLSSGGFTAQQTYLLDFDRPNSWGIAAGDYDKNGYNDLVFGNSQGTNIIKANNDGTGYSMAYSEGGIFTQRNNFVDINNDGHLDVFQCHDVDPNVYWINDGSGNLTFHRGAIVTPGTDNIVSIDQTGAPGGLGIVPDGGNYGSVWIDYDNDHDIDMFIAKCGGGTNGQKNYNELFRNNGDGTYTNVTNPTNEVDNPGSVIDESGLRDNMNTWSSAWADFDNDGDMDVYVGSNSSSDIGKLMRNNCDTENDIYNFTDITASSGLASYTNTGIENVAHDFNNDGYVDILSSGDLLLNNGNGTFTVFNNVVGSGPVGDLNNDGYLDVISGAVYYNTTQNSTNNNWLKVVTIGTQSNINGIGARVEITSSGLGTQIRDVISGDGFRYMSSLNTHFGLGQDASISEVKIYWPSGVVDVLNNVPINQTLSVTEGSHTLSNDLITDSSTAFAIHPNPAKNEINIKTDIQFSNNAYYTVFDMAGRRVLNAFMESTIDVSTLATGNYVLRIISDGKVLTRKFIKE